MWRVSGATVPASRLPTQSPVAAASLWVGLCATRVMTPRPLSTSATSQARLAKAWGPVRRIGCHGGQWVLNPAVIGRQNFLTGVCTFTQGEDACLASLLPILPSADTKQLLEVGALPDVVEDHFARQLKQIGIENVAFLPARHSHDMPVVGTGTHHVLAQPFLADTARPLEGRGAQRIAAPFPIGVEGTTAWLHAAAAAFGIAASVVDQVTAHARQRAQMALQRQREVLAGKHVFFFPDSQLEIPIARFLARELGVVLTKVGTPFLQRGHMAQELAWLPTGTRLSQGQHVESQLDRCRAERADITVCGLGLANPLQAEGPCSSSSGPTKPRRTSAPCAWPPP